MGYSRGRPVAIEGANGDSPRTEIMDMTTFEWTPGAEQTVHSSYWREFSIIQKDFDTFFIVGGKTEENGHVPTVLKYQADVWSQLGDLVHARWWSGLAINGNELLVMGGIAAR